MAISLRTPFVLGYVTPGGEVVASPEFIRILRALDAAVSLATGGTAGSGEEETSASFPGLVADDVFASEVTAQPRPPEETGEMVMQLPGGTNFSGDLAGLTTTVVNGLIVSVA